MNNYKDKLLMTTIMISILLIVCHLRQFVASNFQIEPLVRLILVCIYPFGALIGGRKFTLIFFSIMAYILVWFNTFNNYTSFMIIMLATYFMPKIKKELLILYAIDIMIALVLSDKQISHCLIHGINCFVIYYAFLMIKDFVGIKPLELTKSEVKILNELVSGKSPKEVSCYSTNTVYKRIQEAKERNNCVSTSELLFRYKSTLSYYK